MVLRAFAFLLALALVWGGFAAPKEAALHAASPGEVGCVLTSHGPASPDGWPGDHPMDGQPAQVQAETLADQPGLFQADPDTQTPSLAMTRPIPYASAALPPPYLDGPQRPPCLATTLVA